MKADNGNVNSTRAGTQTGWENGLIWNVINWGCFAQLRLFLITLLSDALCVCVCVSDEFILMQRGNGAHANKVSTILSVKFPLKMTIINNTVK